MNNRSEAKRLDVLRNLDILDTAPETDLDELTRLASLICQTPIALISLVDDHRQWFKSKQGLNVAETPREISFCTHAIQNDQVFLIKDAARDARFSDNPLVKGEPHIRFYAGAPLVYEDGVHLGTLCVIDRQPRLLESHQLEALRTLAKQVVNQIRSRQLRTSLEHLSARLKNVLDSQPAGIIVEDAERRVLLVNESMPRILKLSPTETIQPGESHESWCEKVRTRMAQPADFERETLAIFRAGGKVLNQQFQTQDERWLERDYLPLSFNNMTDSHLWVYRDITERKRDEALIEYQRAQMLESQRLSSLGEMASGLAHEINNPMTVIYGRAAHLQEMAEEKKVTPEQTSRYLEEILEVCQRVMRIVRGLRSFARSGEADPMEPAALTSIIGDTLEFCRVKIRESGVELRVAEIDPDLQLECRPVQVSQIVLNLINNAFDAVRSRDKRWIEVDAVTTSDEVLISVTDSGDGIPVDVREKLFRPFFTTKDSHQGTGLGLAISRRIAEDHDGSIYLDENSPHTRFVLRLPLRAKKS